MRPGKLAAVLVAAVVSLVGAEQPWAGTYQGDWASDASGVRGGFRMTLKAAGEGKWQGEVTFTIAEMEFKTTVKSLKIEGAKIEMSYEYELGDGAGRLMSTITGALEGAKVEGRYQAKTVPDGAVVDEGAWKAARL